MNVEVMKVGTSEREKEKREERRKRSMKNNAEMSVIHISRLKPPSNFSP